MHYKVVTIRGLNLSKDKPTCGILIDTKQGELWFNAFRTPRMEQLNKGETIAVWLYQEEYQGKMMNKFKLPSIDHLLQDLKSTPNPKQVAATVADFEAEEIIEEIPFN